MPQTSLPDTHSAAASAAGLASGSAVELQPSATQRARRIHRVELAVDRGSTGNLDVWSAPDALGRAPAALWHDGSHALTLATFGCVDELRCDVVDIGAARAWCSTIFEQLGRDGAATAWPTLQIGWAFDPQPRTADAGPWRGWPRLWLRLPELAVVARGTSQVHVIAHDDDPDRALQIARDATRRLTVASAHEAAAASGMGGSVLEIGDEQERYQRVVRDALNSIAAGEVHKLVVARAASCRPTARWFDARATARQLRAAHPRAFSFAWRDGSRCFAGASPELLARVRAGEVHSHALAGTTAEPAGDGLLQSPKDRHEHALVVDGIRDALTPLCRQLHVAASPELVSAGPVRHLRSAIAGELRGGEDLLSVGAALHPTPALGGTPRQDAVAWLRSHEGFERGWYGGPIGWLDAHGGGTLAVAIRSLLIEPDRGWAFSGAGIVRASDPTAEWLETCAKLESVRRSLCSRDAHPAEVVA